MGDVPGRRDVHGPVEADAVQFDENVCVDLAKKLMWLQDLRNPVAHRHTLTQIDEIKEIRDECYRILNNLEKIMM